MLLIACLPLMRFAGRWVDIKPKQQFGPKMSGNRHKHSVQNETCFVLYLCLARCQQITSFQRPLNKPYASVSKLHTYLWYLVAWYAFQNMRSSRTAERNSVTLVAVVLCYMVFLGCHYSKSCYTIQRSPFWSLTQTTSRTTTRSKLFVVGWYDLHTIVIMCATFSLFSEDCAPC